MVDVPSFETMVQFEQWLKEKHTTWAETLAVRSVLRVFPLILSPGNKVELTIVDQILVLHVFRVIFTSWTARSNLGVDLRAAALLATESLLKKFSHNSDVAWAATRAARAIGYPTTRAVVDGFDAIESSISAARSAGGIFAAELMQEALFDDCMILQSNSEALIGAPLWSSSVFGSEKNFVNIPSWVEIPLENFASNQLRMSSPWVLIVEWYRAILPNSSNRQPRSLFGQGADIEIATQPEEFWDREPDEVMDAISEIVERAPLKEKASYYNLIVSGMDGRWDGNSGKMQKDRFLEFTKDDVKAKFEPIETSYHQILELPTILAYENQHKRSARVVRMIDLHTSDARNLELWFEPDERFAPISYEELNRLHEQLGIEPSEFSRNHWAIKEVDLVELLAKDNENVEIPSQQPAPIETAIVNDSVVRVHSDHVTNRPDIEAIHAILVVEAAFLANRIDRQAPDVAASIISVSEELGSRLVDMRIYGVGYWAGVLNQIAGRIDDVVLDDAAGRFAGFLTNLNLFLRHSEDWNAYIRTAQNAELAGLVGAEVQSQTPQIIEELAENPEIVSKEVSGPLASLNMVLLRAQTYNPETAYGLYRSLANVLQAVVELSLKDGVPHLRKFANDVGVDARKKLVSWTAGALLLTCGTKLLVLAGAVPSMFSFLNPILRILGIG